MCLYDSSLTYYLFICIFRLNIKACSDDDYKSAQEAWDHFNCKTFADYMHAYLKRDVHQLADVFECFRSLALNGDSLDPAHYWTLPGMCLDSALKMTNACIDLLQEREMYEFVERGVRGGFTFVNRHAVRANVDDCAAIKYEENHSRRELLYIDANNL